MTLSEQQVRGLFLLAGLTPIKIKPLPDGYGYSPEDARYFETLPRQVWYFVKTEFGWVEVGARKRVIHISWEDTRYRGQLMKDEDVTWSDTTIHAWTMPKALEYLTELKHRLYETDSTHVMELRQ